MKNSVAKGHGLNSGPIHFRETDIWGSISQSQPYWHFGRDAALLRGGCPVHSSVFGSSPDFRTLNASGTLHQVMTTKKCLQTLPNVLYPTKLFLVANHCPRAYLAKECKKKHIPKEETQGSDLAQYVAETYWRICHLYQE